MQKIICKPASACCKVCRPQTSSGTSSNCKLHLVVVVQAFQKAKEPKDQGWHVTLCNFRLLVKSNFNTCVVEFVLIKCVLNTCKKNFLGLYFLGLGFAPKTPSPKIRNSENTSVCFCEYLQKIQ